TGLLPRARLITAKDRFRLRAGNEFLKTWTAPRCSSMARPRFSMEKTRAFFQSARRYEVDPNAGADAARNKSPVALQEELVRGGAMRRRARRQWRKAPPSQVRPAYLSHARFLPAW